MRINIIYRQFGEWYVGHIQEYPDYESQGAALDELKENLRDVYSDIRNGLFPETKPAHVAELGVYS